MPKLGVFGGMRHLFCFLLLSSALVAEVDGSSQLLNSAAEKWLSEGDRWAFTVKIKEFSGGEVKEERVERYDPSKPGIARWELLEVNGQPPTDERRAEWQKRKTKKRKAQPKMLGDYLDFESATIASATARDIRYHVPLKNSNRWLFPVDRVNLTVAVNKSTREIEQIEAGIDEPFRVALGLARILNVDLDLRINPDNQAGVPDGPATAKPEGQAHVVVNRFGERIEYSWSNFQRVTPHPDNVLSTL
ncbi:MAG: hypothetical protein JWM32_1930 [Verrucomicrobia bacterium]|nr:hypothetical protein [Verrucomicrobiota bacterium]